MKRTISLILVLVTLLSAFTLTSCKKDEEFVSEIVYDSFEKWENDFSRILLLNDFGKVSFNDKEEFVKFGGGSAKIEPSGATNSTLKPLMLFPTRSEMMDYDYSDFTNVEKISLWLYNAQEKEMTVGIGVSVLDLSTGQWYDKLDRVNAIQFNLVSGWNYIEYQMYTQYLACHQEYKSDNVNYVYFEFDYLNPIRETAPVFYMDDMRFHYSKTPVEGGEISLKVDEQAGVYEISDFEDQRQVLFNTIKVGNLKNRLSTTIVNASKYNQTAKSGKNVLEIIKRPGTWQESQGWPYFTISEKVFEIVFGAIGEDIVNNPQNYEIKFDYFNASPIEHGMSITYTTTSGKGDIQPWQGITAKPYTWGEYSISVQRLQEVLDTAVAEGKVTLNDGYGKANYMVHPGKMVFVTDGFSHDLDTRERVFLIDNMRVERIVAE